MYWRMWLVTLLHTIFGFSCSIQPGILNPVELLAKEFANETIRRYGREPTDQSVSLLWGLLNAAFPLGNCLSPFVLAYCSDKWGRRATVMIINSCIVLLSAALALLSQITDLFELLLLSRFLSGLAEQIAMFIFIYLMECCPPQDANMASAIARVGDIGWYVFGTAIGLPELMGTEYLWKYMLAIPAAPMFVYLCLTPLVPESPKHLLLTAHQEQQATESILLYHGPHTDVSAVMQGFREEQVAGGSNASICYILSLKHLRWPFIICLVASFATRINGYDIDNFYSTELIYGMGVPIEQAALYNVLILRLPMILMALLFIAVVNHLSVRTFLLTTAFVGSVSVSTLCLSQSLPQSNFSTVLLIGSLAIEICAFHLGGCVLPKMLPALICTQSIRSMTTAYATGVMAVTAVVVTFGFAPLVDAIGAVWTLLPLVILSWMSLAFLFKYLPDTDNKSINEISQQWLDDDDDEAVRLVQMTPCTSDTISCYGSNQSYV